MTPTEPFRFACDAVMLLGLLYSAEIWAQQDPGVRGGIQNTGGGLHQQGIPIPHPPLISPHPVTGTTVNDNHAFAWGKFR